MESLTFGKTALIHQTKEILKTKLHTGCVRKIVKNGENKSPLEHTFIWRLAILKWKRYRKEILLVIET